MDNQIEDQKPSQPTPPKPLSLTKPLVILIILVLGWAGWTLYQNHFRAKTEPVLSTLMPVAFQPLPLGQVMPKGWLLDQLKLQASGLSGHLDEFWPDIKDSGWIGGSAEGWERAPYWLDGLVPLATLTDDPKMKRKVKRWMDYILTHPLADGWLGPYKSPPATGSQGQPPDPLDPWPQFIILKVLTQYQEATGDPRVIPAMERDLRSLSAQMDQRVLFAWNFFRWGDLLVSIDWLYDRTGEPWLLDLERKAASQGYNWPKHFSDLPLKEKSKGWNWVGHVVNNAMGLKVPAMLYRLTGDGDYSKLADKAWEQLDRYHGEPNGLMSGDECLAGKSPSQGTELCAIVETMFSLETTLSVLGGVQFADRLEKIAFNALPAAISPDYWTHQYVEQSNQVACVYFPKPVYATVTGEGNIFGLAPHYGCCTANFHQGWPKLASHLWMGTPDGGLAAVVYAPSVVQTKVSRTNVKIELATDYPFSEDLTFQVSAASPVDFPLYLRIPAWCKDATATLPDGSILKMVAGNFQPIRRRWSGTETVRLKLPMTFRVYKGFQDSESIERGPLVFSLGIKEVWKVARPFRFQAKDKSRDDYEIVPGGPWNYALVLDKSDPDKSLTFQQGTLKGNPFTLDGAPEKVIAQGKLLPSWGFSQGAADPPPPSPVHGAGALESLTLVPYGSTRLRVTSFPISE